ncbi:hypothetical protein ILUMI_14850, partial [Ignelater luminosus]
MEIVLYHDNKIINKSKELARVFVKYYSSSVQEKLKNHFGNSTCNCTTVPTNNSSFYFYPVTITEIKDVVNTIQNKPSTGIEEVPISLIKECLEEFAMCFLLLINKSMELGQFPSRLKTALIVLVFKKRKAKDIKNYKPISLLSIFSKVIEKIVANRIIAFLQKFCFISDFQHEDNYSTETAAVELVQSVNESLDKNKHVFGIFFDLTSAFDTIDISFLEIKLEKLGIREKVLEWIISWMENRQIRVKINEVISEEKTISVGTPQGSVLGPLIFILYVNELENFVSYGKAIMYADDRSIIVEGKSIQELEHRVNHTLHEFNDWGFKNKLIINYNKT